MKNSNMEIPVTFKDPLEQWNEFDLEEKKLNKNIFSHTQHINV